MAAALMLGAVTLSANGQTQLIGGDDEPERISAFPCIVCSSGGDVFGIRAGSKGRAVRSFGAFQKFCVSDYRYAEGELQVRFKLEGELWPADEDWALQADSWQAVCKTSKWKLQ